MIRRIITNIALAFIFIPLLNFADDYAKLEIIGNPRTTITVAQSIIHFAMMYTVYVPLFFLICILLPYNFILLRNDWTKSKTMFLKFCIFMGVILINLVFVSFFTLLWSPKLMNNLYLILVLSGIALFCTSILHYVVDTKDR